MSNSLALFTDVLHLGSDLVSFLISLLSMYLARKSATHHMSFGYHRAGKWCTSFSLIYSQPYISDSGICNDDVHLFVNILTFASTIKESLSEICFLLTSYVHIDKIFQIRLYLVILPLRPSQTDRQSSNTCTIVSGFKMFN